ncbi:MAG: hypothetical protein HYV75_04150 [Opitutae bacterium]|nr:hypothetical protein [Opitutae bacterium]
MSFLCPTALFLWFTALGLASAARLAAGDVPAAEAAPPADGRLAGVMLTHGRLRARITDNTIRLNAVGDGLLPGYNGVASLVSTDQERNIFAPAGLNYEIGSTVPKMGRLADRWNAPRLAPMTLEQLDARTIRLTQKGADAAGLNIEIVFHLGEAHLDQTITTWPDADIESSFTFWASYLLLVPNTSLYLRASLKDAPQPRWLELTSAGHNGSGDGTYFRPCDPAGKAWHEFLTDDPLRRQAVFETPASRAATEAAGFRLGEMTSFDNFYFGFVDDHVALWIFRPPANGRFIPRLSASGAQALRRPAWDHGILSGAQRAGERRTFHVRFVYKPFAGVDDVLQEVERFQRPEPHGHD